MPYPAAYFRGVFDGDGHGGYYAKRGRPQLRLGVTSGSRAFLEDMAVLLPAPIGGPYRGKGNSWQLQTSTERAALAIRDWMYADGGPCSPRKRAKLH